jgi:hypothetical protein
MFIIFRPVVIPLLSDYVVSTGFVSSRDFLIGLVTTLRYGANAQAVIQAFPGPNFVKRWKHSADFIELCSLSRSFVESVESSPWSLRWTCRNIFPWSNYPKWTPPYLDQNADKTTTKFVT